MAKFNADKPDLLYNLLYLHAVNNAQGIHNSFGFRLCKYDQVYPKSYSELVTHDWQCLLDKSWNEINIKD